MMKSLLRSPKELGYASVVWHDSKAFPEVRFAVRRPSLGQRIELTGRVRELMAQHEFLKAGDSEDQLTAALSELLVKRLYLEWGLTALRGISIDGEPASIRTLIECGPEKLTDEIAEAVIREASLTEDERKNS
ncbi:MAG TPA: hypothetical protein VHZ55_00275 [Bryobacteraceae bacterium]|jgi:hypothetical protein|nr:hypothetical protein [Bryobacteraceae bacterium]